ncbi:hypothetical protein [Streptomyces yaizuensis]|uniref:Uncharacterized protein n=1 Tax=Streptomyces yaizuensis TaxID=2989713 RepID=A0ABQ5NQJ5_9ACTN|nr:hypothetical protein [Streptomyces sp. YSPA8]GLF92653.1 hypothetical protein SYYSPA8_00170 [Streptomyces sp. YSPA8]
MPQPTTPTLSPDPAREPAAYSSLTHALADALIDILRYVDACDDGQVALDDAVRILEGMAHVVDLLSEEQRQELRELLRAMAEGESDPGRRDFLAGFPEGFGLDEDGTDPLGTDPFGPGD